ncbi:hypothetical protein [Sebaldella sp. S0638]|uniref:hypothetical protein n=1 Tax=Sebaldella sp. S0638 TaxID=2957809 RepID=UPI0020A12EA2|nr:hypothetical protein [Sebaldella sp. S0638]MCP1225710.1 hypothetical protein [Sebaldella sp. S0638]
MAKFQGALVTEQGITFGIVIVKMSLLRSSSSSIEDFRNSCVSLFPGVPIILMAQDSRGIPTYHGRKDIVNFLASIDYTRIPWREYSY